VGLTVLGYLYTLQAMLNEPLLVMLLVRLEPKQIKLYTKAVALKYLGNDL
jgi:hypothetical protein